MGLSVSRKSATSVEATFSSGKFAPLWTQHLQCDNKVQPELLTTSGVTRPSAAGARIKNAAPPKKCSNGIGVASDIVTYTSIG